MNDIEILEDFKTIKILYGNTFVMHLEQLEKIQQAIENLLKERQEDKEKINKCLEMAFEYGQIDGEHHKTWVIDQIVRTLTGKDYDKWLQHYEYDEEEDEEYEWDTGIAP